MPPPENKHVFIIRVWCEPREIKGAFPEFRGVIEHVPDGKRRYVKKVEELVEFISPYLDQMGLRPGWRSRVKRGIGNFKYFLSTHFT